MRSKHSLMNAIRSEETIVKATSAIKFFALFAVAMNAAAQSVLTHTCNSGYTQDGSCHDAQTVKMTDRRALHSFSRDEYDEWLNYCKSNNTYLKDAELCYDVIEASNRCPTVDFRTDPILRKTCDRIGIGQACIDKRAPSELAPIVKKFIATKLNTLKDPPWYKLADGDAGQESLHSGLRPALAEEATIKTITLIGRKNFNASCTKSIKSMLESTGISKDLGFKANFGGAATLVAEGLSGIYSSVRLYQIGACQLALVRRDLGSLTYELDDWEKENLSKCESIVQPHQVAISAALAEWIVKSAAAKFSACSPSTPQQPSLPSCE